jgi:hypothetical protein
MMKSRLVLSISVVGLALGSVAVPFAQQNWGSDDWCRGENWGRDRQGVCDVRQMTMGAPATLSVDAEPNGGIQVRGGSRGDVRIYAKVVATADTEQRAREIANGVRIDAAGDRIAAEGPSGLDRRENWHVSYRIEVPTQSSLNLRSSNGGLNVQDVEGKMELRTVNGGVNLRNVAGEVIARTSNGGIDVDLDGPSWVGAGLDVETSNGGVKVRLPENYSARLEASTHNGGLEVDFPVQMQNLRSREISANIGAGGPTIKVKTSNGGVRISKK